MTNADFFAERWEAEQAAFRKVLHAIPTEQLSYNPHERSTSAGNLAWQLAEEQRGLVDLLERGETTYVNRPRPATIDEIVASWDEATEEVRKILASRDDAKWSEQGKFLVGTEVAWADTIRNLLWGFLFDMVHHRGQLSSYLRPMGCKVPSIYGPSGDDKGA